MRRKKKIENNEPIISVKKHFHSLHYGAITTMDIQGNLLATAGEDGSLNIISVENQISQRSIVNANSSSTYSVRFNSPSTLITVGMGGRLLVWDIRSNSNKPSSVCVYNESYALTSLCAHPSRSDTLATGSMEGILNIWDIRSHSTPTSSLQAHSSSVRDLLFLPSQPTCIITCGEDGSLSLLDFNKDRRDPTKVNYSSEQQSNIQAVPLYQSELSINSLDIDPKASNPHTILCGSDTESLIFFQHFWLEAD